MTTTSTGADPVIRVSPFAPLWVCFLFVAVWLAVCFAIAARFVKWQ